MSNTKLILGMAGAAATGVLIGMMLAPEKGAEMRKKIRKTTDDCLHNFVDWIARESKTVLNGVKEATSEKPETGEAEA